MTVTPNETMDTTTDAETILVMNFNFVTLIYSAQIRFSTHKVQKNLLTGMNQLYLSVYTIREVDGQKKNH